jgi:aspartate/methionine/tyrosine aminotransferase
MIHDTAMQRILFHGREMVDPLMFPGMQVRTISVGAASKEYRMIGWRVGWIVCPLRAAETISRVAISNVVCPVGIAQQEVATAIEAVDDGIAECSRIWQQRQDNIVAQLGARYTVVPAHGGWSLLIDCAPLGMPASAASARLLQHGVAATAMHNWGLPDTERYLRLVYANESVERLHDIGQRFAAAFGR